MKMKIRKLIAGFFIVVLMVALTFKSYAQSPSDLRFNEILVLNDSSNVDDFGMHSSWIEIFNSAHNSVELGGCYLTDDLNNPTKYWIPIGDPVTEIPSRCYILLWADNKPSRGILHLNFDLKEAKTIALFDASGRNLIDKLEITSDQQPDVSYGILSAETGEWGYLDKITPAANNDHSRRATSGDEFVKMDPAGFGMSIISMTFVFLALILLYIVFKLLGNISKKAAIRAGKLTVKPTPKVNVVIHQGEVSGEVNAAIAMALYMYQDEMHDQENTVLTMKRVSRTYSPWSSKIYTLRKNPR